VNLEAYISFSICLLAAFYWLNSFGYAQVTAEFMMAENYHFCALRYDYGKILNDLL